MSKSDHPRSGRTVVVAGATGGIGEGMTRALLRRTAYKPDHPCEHTPSRMADQPRPRTLAAGPVLRNDISVLPYHRLAPAHHGPQYAQQPLTESRSGLLDRITQPTAEAIERVMTVAGAVAAGLIRPATALVPGSGDRWAARRAAA